MQAPRSVLPAGKPAVLYLRRSTERQEQSIADQRAYLVRFAAENDFEILDEFIDDGISGTSADGRADFQRMIKEAQGKARFRAILVYDIKRFSRGDVDEAGYYRHLLRQSNIDVVYATENFGDDFVGDLLRPIRQIQARQESVDLSRLTARGQMSAVQAGSYFGSTPPWGFDYQYRDSRGEPYQTVRYLQDGTKEIYLADGTLKVKVPLGDRPPRMDNDTVRLVHSLPERVAIIRRIFHFYVQEGLGIRAIANGLNRERVPSARCGWWGTTYYNGRWSATSVANIVKNQVYVGDSVWNKRTMAKFHRIRDGKSVPRPRHEAGVIAPNPREHWIITPNTHEPIISRATFESAQRILAGRDKSATFRHKLVGRGRTSNFLLAGLIQCERCNHRFSGWSQKIKRKVKPAPEDRRQVYLCGGYLQKGNAICRRAAIEKKPFEEFIVSSVQARLEQVLEGGGMNVIRAYVEEELLLAQGDPKAELAKVDAELARLKADADRLLSCLTPANSEFIDEKLIEIKGRRRDLDLRREGLEQAARRTVSLEAATEAVLAHLTRFREVLACGSFAEQKEFLGGFVEGITLDAVEKTGTLKMRDMIAASFSTTGWHRQKLYRRMRRLRIPVSFGRL